MKIGIFGGSFNPPHNMHKNIALDLIKKGYADKIIYVPTGDTYQKKELIEFEYRYNMVKIITKNYDNLSVSNISNDNNYKYTYQTLDYFQNIYKNDIIYFICGTDNLKEFDTWKEYKYILEKYKLLIIKRNNDDIDNILNKYKEHKNNVIITNVIPNGISSTYIRSNIETNDIKQYLDDKVYDYIKKFNLYKDN